MSTPTRTEASMRPQNPYPFPPAEPGVIADSVMPCDNRSVRVPWATRFADAARYLGTKNPIDPLLVCTHVDICGMAEPGVAAVEVYYAVEDAPWTRNSGAEAAARADRQQANLRAVLTPLVVGEWALTPEHVEAVVGRLLAGDPK